MTRIEANGEISRDGTDDGIEMDGEIPIFEPPKGVNRNQIKELIKNVGAKGVEKQTKEVKEKAIKLKEAPNIKEEKDR